MTQDLGSVKGIKPSWRKARWWEFGYKKFLKSHHIRSREMNDNPSPSKGLKKLAEEMKVSSTSRPGYDRKPCTLDKLLTIDDILTRHLHEIKAGHDGKLKQELQDLIMKVIGETPSGHIPDELCCDACDLRAEQRARLEEIFK